MRTIVNDNRKAGEYNIRIEAGNLGTGVYFYKLTAGKYSQVKKMMVIK